MTPQPSRPALNTGPERPEPQPTPTRSAHLRSLVQALITFASTLVETLTAPIIPQETQSALAIRFGTTSLALITARIARALLMAIALNNRLARSAKQLDHPTTPRAAAIRTKPRRPRTPALSPAADDAALLARLPTLEEIAAQIRHRPIGRIIEDICRDLGIRPADPLWRDAQMPIIANGGSLVRLFKHVSKRITCSIPVPLPGQPGPHLQIATGPP